MLYHIRTFGCQMNVYDSDFIARSLEDAGFSPSETPHGADIIVVNTCTVRQHAEDRVLSYVGGFKRLAAQKPSLKIYFVGCVAARLGDKIKKRFPFVTAVIAPDALESFSETAKRLAVGGATDVPSEKHAPRRCEFVTISRGCSNRCSYCIVPSVRGPELSRSPDEILREISDLAAQGFGRITLIGQNVNSYRSGDTDFPALLSAAASVKGVENINFLTNHPKDMTDEIIETVGRLAKVGKNFHLPAQSGSDRILALMNRGYTRGRYAAILQKIRKTVAAAKITTDIIVGYPTETDADFEETLRLLVESNFDGIFAFKYSPREGTPAYSSDDDVPTAVKASRLARVLEYAKSGRQ